MAVLVTEPRASCMANKHSTTELGTAPGLRSFDLMLYFTLVMKRIWRHILAVSLFTEIRVLALVFD